MMKMAPHGSYKHDIEKRTPLSYYQNFARIFFALVKKIGFFRDFSSFGTPFCPPTGSFSLISLNFRENRVRLRASGSLNF